MNEHATDQSVLNHIQELVQQEHRFHGQEGMTDEDRARLRDVQVELDQYWDLLRQRRALRGIGQDPDKAHVRPADIVEKYDQ
jgi:hypothetical protein